jgi:hypothetical protein
VLTSILVLIEKLLDLVAILVLGQLDVVLLVTVGVNEVKEAVINVDLKSESVFMKRIPVL